MTNPSWIILEGYRGSHAHGTNIDPAVDPEFGTDDVDLMSVVVPDSSYYLGLNTFGSRGTREIVDGELDHVQYEVRKYITLLLKGNPNVLSLLWLEESPVAYGFTHITHAGRLLIDAREHFTRTRQTVSAFIGYAAAQRAKMDHNLTIRAYMGEKRRALAERFGYDTKHAAHLLRLQAMVIELLREGTLTIDRTRRQGATAAYLRDVKRGMVPLKDVLELATAQLEVARELEKQCKFPKTADPNKASALCERVIRVAWETP